MRMKILKEEEVVNMVGLSRISIWRMERAGDFPKRLQLGARKVGWLQDEVENFITSRPRGVGLRVSV